MRAIVRLLALASCGLTVLLATTAAASAATLHVTSGADSGAGTLRAAVAAASSGDTIIIDPGVNPSLTSGDEPVVIAGGSGFSLNIEGQGARSTTINANAGSVIFEIDTTGNPPAPPFVQVTLSQMTLTDGAADTDFDNGGALEISDGNVSLDHVALTHNFASSNGGAISVCGGSLTLTAVSVVGNTSQDAGGGIAFTCPSSTSQITNSTIAGNMVTSGEGGGLAVLGRLGSVALVDDTVFGNTAVGNEGSAGGDLESSPGSTLSLRNTIVADGTSPVGASCSGAGITSQGDNLEDTTPSQCGFSALMGDMIGVAPMFRTTAPVDNGGETDTLALAPGSPAVDHVPAPQCGAASDQRGMPRPGDPSSACDIGAYELQHSTPVAVACAPTSLLVGTPTSCVATATGVAGADLGPPTGRVTFTSDTAGSFSGGGSCILAGGAGPTAGCAVTYTPAAFGTGTHRILAAYGGDATYSAGGASAIVSVTRRTDSASASCSRGTVPVGGSTTCTVIVTDTQAGGAASAPSGSVGFSSDASGSFSRGGSCALSGAGTTAGCSVTFTPSRNDSGTLAVTARYAGDATHGPATGPTSVATSPVSGVSGNVTVLAGTVVVTEPAGPTPHAAGAAGPVVTSVPLKGQTVSVPMGSTIDARKGEVALATAADYMSAQNSHHSIQTGVFQASMFSVRQLTARQQLNRLRKKHKRRLTGIPVTGLVLANPPGAAAAARCRRAGPPGRGIVRSLHGTAKGNYETIGAASITTITNGLWTVEDRCDGTLTEVGRGRAIVTPTHGAHPTSVVVKRGQAVIVKARFLPLKGISKGQSPRVARSH